MILACKTDQPKAELYVLKDQEIVDSLKWQAHRELSNTLIEKIETLLANNSATLADLWGLIVYEGPGSFTGLRISITVLNTLAYARGIPIAGAQGDDWIVQGLENMKSKKVGDFVTPHYGSEPHITKARK